MGREMVHAPGHFLRTFFPLLPINNRLSRPFGGTMRKGQMSPENPAAVSHLTADQEWRKTAG